MSQERLPLTPKGRARRIEEYASAPKRLRKAINGIPPEAMKWRPAPGEFSIHEIVCHCADAEMVDATRIRYLIAERNPVIVPYNESEWASVLDYHSHPLESALDTVDAVHANTLALLQRLPEEAWAAVGRQAVSGSHTADDWLLTWSEHIDEHSDQVNRNLESWSASRDA